MTALKIPVFIVALIGVLLVCIAFQPPPGRPKVSVTFLGYTNDSTAGRLASFAVSNLSPCAVFRAPYCEIQTSSPKGWTGQPGGFLLTGAQLALGSCDFSKDKAERFVTVVTAAFAMWNVGLAFVVGITLATLAKRGLLRL